MSGICVCFEGFNEKELDEMKSIIRRLEGATFTDSLKIEENSHLIYKPTLKPNEANSLKNNYDRAFDSNIPIVTTSWLSKCNETKSIVPATEYYVRKFIE